MPSVRKLLRALSARDEFIIVVVAAFGPFIIAGISGAVLFRPGAPLFNQTEMRGLVISEILVLIPLAAFLHIRGWTLKRIGLGPNFTETLVGIGLVLIVNVLTGVIWYAATRVFWQLPEVERISNFVEGPIDTATIMAVSLVNPVFEEVFLCGYVMTFLKERAGVWTAINVSTAIRLTCHLYQGAIGVFIAPLGLVFAGFYAFGGRLWPLIVAHFFFDFFPLTSSLGGGPG